MIDCEHNQRRSSAFQRQENQTHPSIGDKEKKKDPADNS